jgi:uncharacterized damage-inducible protein DinB
MTASANNFDETVSAAFIAEARRLLKTEYLPKLERCLEQLSDEQIWWRPNDSSNSIGNLLLHLSGNARQWIVCSLGGKADERIRDAEFQERSVLPREQLLSQLRETIADVDSVLGSFDSALLLNKYPIQGTESTALDAILHVTEHFSMHTGQIILLTKMMGNVDLVFYDFSNGKPVHTWHTPKAS